MKDVLISCDDLSVGYGKHIIQSDITLAIYKGDYICVIGQNGAGKSTFIKTILGLIPPISGMLNYTSTIRDNGIGYLPQQGVIQKNFPTSVKEVILSGRQNKIKFFYSKADKELAMEMAEKFGISGFWNKRYSDLSGGQQQRVLLARALCATDALLVLDEPVTGLDIETQEKFYQTVKEINEKGTTIVMITHDKDALSMGATHIFEFGNGKVEVKKVNDNG